jgi:predicted metal-binding membrane protein
MLWAHPEWWIVGLGTLAWVPMLKHGIATPVHASHQVTSFGTELGYWHAMVLAMMLPTMAFKARDVAFRSLSERRHRAIGLFLVGYFGPWSALGILAAWPRSVLWTHSPWLTVGAFAVATVWACLPIRERAMVMSYGYAPVIAPEGRSADRDCLRSGLIVGSWCLVSCWALMLACAWSGHHLIAITLGASIGIAESVSFRPPRVFVLAVSAALTTFFAVSSIVGPLTLQNPPTPQCQLWVPVAWPS